MGKLKDKRKSKKVGGKPARKRKVSISTVLMSIVLVVGLCIMAYPTFSDWWNSFHQTRAIEEYVQAVEELDPKTIEKMLKAAQKYNETLVDDPGRFNMTDEERDAYNSLLNLTGNGLMGYIQIPTIGVNLPIYHGVDETHLQVAIGHIEGSSLPVGGKSTHAVVSGHRGLPSAKLFSDLDKLSEGDTFTFTVLKQKITYEVDQIRIVEPEDFSDLAIAKDKDYATLITCTPYGINTHRMLVRGHRVDKQSDRNAVPAGAIQIPNYIAIPAVGIPMLFVYLLVALIMRSRRRPALDKEKALEAVREHAKELEEAAETGKSEQESTSANEGK
ncbi:MAG: class C sortase [Atopobiaceae bacterium]|nr:class C sortase [Atopobiaceae bacterium]